jgi:hypothetical protein
MDKPNYTWKATQHFRKESGYNPEVKFSLLSGLKEDIGLYELKNFVISTVLVDQFNL